MKGTLKVAPFLAWSASALLCAILLELVDVRADTLRNCLPLMNSASQSVSTNGSISPLALVSSQSFSIVSTATNVSGTSPTLDAKVQTCRSSTDATTCKDLPTAFTQCTASAGPCYDSTGYQGIDFATKQFVNTWPYFRAVTTLGGTSPVFKVKVEVCTGG